MDLTTHQWQRLTYESMDGALINGNLFDVLVAPSYFTIQPVRSEIAMSALHPKVNIVRHGGNVRFGSKADITL